MEFKDFIKLVDSIRKAKKEETKISKLEELVKFVNSEEYKSIVNEMLSVEKLDSHDILILEYIIKASNLIYSNTGDSTGISDTDYDKLVSVYESTTGNSVDIDSDVITSKSKVQSTYLSLRGSIGKVYKLTSEDKLISKSQKSIEDYISYTENLYKDLTGKKIDLMEEDVLVTPKFDGVSVEIEYSKNGGIMRAVTRGNLDTGEALDVTDIMRDVLPVGPLLHTENEYGLKTECIMSDYDLKGFNEYCIRDDDYKTARSAVSSIINGPYDKNKNKFLYVIPLRIAFMGKDGKEYGEDIPEALLEYPHLICKMKDLSDIREFAFDHKMVHPGFKTDGVVITLMNKKLWEVLGRANNKNRFEIAYKFTQEIGYTKVTGVKFTVGYSGKISAILKLEKIKLKGYKIENASIGIQAFRDYDLGIGDTVRVIYDTVPYVVFDETDPKCIHVKGAKKLEEPIKCPECKEFLLKRPPLNLPVCVNKNCVCRKKGRIYNYLSKIGVEDVGYETVSDLYDYKYLTCIEDVYTLKKHKVEIANLPSFGERKVDNIITNINNHKEMAPSRFFGALGIKGFGEIKFAKIFRYLSVNEFLDICDGAVSSALAAIPGIGMSSALNLIQEIDENVETIDYLLDKITLTPEKTSNSIYRVAFSKIRSKELEEWILANRGSIDNSISTSTSVLIVPRQGISSTKVDAAYKCKVPIVDIYRAKNYIMDHFLAK